MPIRFRCVYCDKLLGIARRKAGAVVNCPHCSEKLIVPTPEQEEAAAPSEDEAIGTVDASPRLEQKAAPLFERSDFSALLQGEPTFRTSEDELLPPPPKLTHKWEPAASPMPAPYQPAPSLAPPPFIHEAPPRPPGFFISPSKATWLSVAAVVLLAIAFAGGLLVGRFLKG